MIYPPLVSSATVQSPSSDFGEHPNYSLLSHHPSPALCVSSIVTKAVCCHPMWLTIHPLNMLIKHPTITYTYIYIFFSSNTITKVRTFLHTTGCFNAIAIHLSTIPQGRMNNGMSCTPTARARIRTQARGFAASHNNHCATEQGIW